MAGLGTVLSLLPLGLDFFEGWQQRKQQVKMAEHDARIQAAQNGVALRNRKVILYTSFWMVAYPFLSMWIPWWGLSDHTFAVMEKLQKLPPIALWSWLIVIAGIWGVGVKDIPAKLWKK